MRASLLLAAFVVCTAIALPVWRYFGWHTIRAEHRDSYMCEYGYRLEERSSSGTIRLAFYSCHHQWRYELTGTDLTGEIEARWLGKHRAVFLAMTTHPFHNSMGIKSRERLLYDFETGQLSVVTDTPVSGTDHLAIWPNALRKGEAEMQHLVQQLGP